MENSLILIEECCRYYKVDDRFIEALADLGLLSIQQQENARYLPETQLADLEKFAVWHYDLDISPAGIDTIHGLLAKIKAMEAEMQQMRSHLHYFKNQYHIDF